VAELPIAPAFQVVLCRREAHSVTLAPVLQDQGTHHSDDGTIVFFDEVMLKDLIHERCPCVMPFLYNIQRVAFIVLSVGAMFVLPIMPFAVLEYTNTTKVLLAAAPSTLTNALTMNGNATNNTMTNATTNTPASAAAAPPLWPEGWTTFSLVFSAIYLCAGIWLCTFMAVFEMHRGLLRRLVQEKWPGMVVTVFTGWAYAGIAASLQPNGSHILFLVYTKVVLPAWLCLQDSLNVGIHLRVTKAGFEEALGKQGKEASQKTRKMWGMLLSWSFIILVDLLRHFKTPPLLRRR
jgi:hypothetical protein